MEDEILNFDTRKSTDRRCEFWLEFENGVKLQAEMLDVVSPLSEAIPPVEPILSPTPKPIKKEVVIRGGDFGAQSSTIEIIRQSVDSHESLNSKRSENKAIMNESKGIMNESKGILK